ncbi:MAG: hypothetical protein KJO83_06565 [Bacteroidia bacterium]|nr:hypothetical protein [Bacteroidia bacterium]
MLKRQLYIILFGLFCLNMASQNTPGDLKIKKKDSSYVSSKMDILAPSKAAFYSAVLPGLGQVYNKKYWKVPLVYAALGTGVYFYVDNNKGYDRYRTAFKLRESGRQDEFTTDEGIELVSDAGLKRAQEVFKKNRDLSLFITIGMYILNIVEANVDAHLPDKALDTNISFNPTLFTEPLTNQTMIGATINFNF